MFSLTTRKEKQTCNICGIQTSRNHLVRRREEVRLEFGTAQNVPLSQLPPRMTSIIIFLRSTAPQNKTLPSNVSLVTKFPGIYVLIQHKKTRNPEWRLDQEQELWMWNTKLKILRILGSEKSCVLISISWRILNLKGRDKKYSITQCEILTKQL